MSVQIVPARVERVRVIRFSQEAWLTSSTTLDSCRGRGKYDERKHRLIDRSHFDEITSEIGEVFWAKVFELSRRTDLIRRIPGHHLIDRRGVIKEAIGGVGHGSNHGESIINLAQFWKVFGELNSRYFRADITENALNIIRDIFFRIL